MKLPFARSKKLRTLEEIGSRCGTDKIRRHGYHRFYPLFLEQHRNAPLVILEIGLYKGASLNMWLEYFPSAFVYGLDVNGPEQKGERFHVLQGDQGDLRSLAFFEGKSIDLIVDDGSHLPDHQLSSFSFLFSRALKEGGTYIIEDIETSYWRRGELYGNQFAFGFRSPRSAVEAFKNGVDFLNDEFMRDEDRQLRNDACTVDLKSMSQIATITFAQNCIVLQKKRPEFAKYEDREYRLRDFL